MRPVIVGVPGIIDRASAPAAQAQGEPGRTWSAGWPPVRFLPGVVSSMPAAATAATASATALRIFSVDQRGSYIAGNGQSAGTFT